MLGDQHPHSRRISSRMEALITATVGQKLSRMEIGRYWVFVCRLREGNSVDGRRCCVVVCSGAVVVVLS